MLSSGLFKHPSCYLFLPLPLYFPFHALPVQLSKFSHDLLHIAHPLLSPSLDPPPATMSLWPLSTCLVSLDVSGSIHKPKGTSIWTSDKQLRHAISREAGTGNAHSPCCSRLCHLSPKRGDLSMSEARQTLQHNIVSKFTLRFANLESCLAQRELWPFLLSSNIHSKYI